MTVNQRFGDFLHERKISISDFAKKTGIISQTVGDIVNGKTKQPKSNFFQAVATHYPEVNLRWLLVGEGEMYLNKNQESKGANEGIRKLKEEELQIKAKLGEMVMETDGLRKQLYKMGEMMMQVIPIVEKAVGKDGENPDREEYLSQLRELLADMNE